MTYALSIGCILWRRVFGEPLPPARWSLGTWGVPINAYSVLYTLYTVVISFFPTFNNPDADGMNWGVAVSRVLKIGTRFNANLLLRCSEALQLLVSSITLCEEDTCTKDRWYMS